MGANMQKSVFLKAGTAAQERRNKMIDKMMKKYGYQKTEENQYGAYYEKLEKAGYTHVVCVIAKQSGKHLMQSYDKECIEVPGRAWLINEGAGVEVPVLLLMWLKAKCLAHKYHWERRTADHA